MDNQLFRSLFKCYIMFALMGLLYVSTSPAAPPIIRVIVVSVGGAICVAIGIKRCTNKRRGSRYR